MARVRAGRMAWRTRSEKGDGGGLHSDGHRQADGQNFEPDGEKEEQQQGQPEGGGAGGYEGIGLDEPIPNPAPVGSGHRSKEKSDGSRQGPGDDQQP